MLTILTIVNYVNLCYNYFNSFSAETVFRRHNRTSLDVTEKR